jgi:YD repeat-containing protein
VIAVLVFTGIVLGCGAGQPPFLQGVGQPTRDYLYDPNGNLVEIREASIPVLTATHDAQDRLVYAAGLPVARLFPDGSVESIFVYGTLALLLV